MTFNLNDFLIKSLKAQASDIHLNCDKEPVLRINGEIYKITSEKITLQDIYNIVEKTIRKEYLKGKTIQDIQNLDYIYELKDISRYRINFAKDIYGAKLTFRTIPYQIKTLQDLSLPEYLQEYTKFNNGIVIVTGATGAGKSTTLASLIELINQEKKCHIITIEDPVEFVYEDKKALITQRNLELDVKDFSQGIKYALRQDPDIMLVGEIRDKDTLYSAIEAAETGHLVFTTLHTNGTVASIDRLKGFVSQDNQHAFQKRLTNCIRAIIHQQLVPMENGLLVPAIELLTFTPTVIDYIAKGDLHEVELLMQRSKQPNLVTMNTSLFSLYKQGLISSQTALEYSLNKVEINQMLKGIERGIVINNDNKII